MKQKAFTLFEILLTVGIIGIIATTLIRVLPNVMPDVNKAKFLRAYTTTKIVVNDIINAIALYPEEDPNDPNYGLKNKEKPEYGIYAEDKYTGDDKFPLIFADMLSLEGENGEFYSMRDNLTYLIKPAANDGYTITFKNGEVFLGGVKVAYDGKTQCFSEKGYCTDMTDLRRK